MIKIRPPLFIASFKSYIEATGRKAIKLAKIVEKVSLDTDTCMIVLPQFLDIPNIAREVNIPVFAQHIDPIKPGAFTGHVLPEAVKEAGAAGTMINHKERRLTLTDINKVIKRAKEVQLIPMVCADSPEEAVAIANFKPDIILAEPPELIGTGKAVSQSDPRFVTESVKKVKNVDPNIICIIGAGITTAEDVSESLRLGADGAGAASAIVKAKDPYSLLMEIAKVLSAR